MVTDHLYKGYIIRLKMKKGSGGAYQIYKNIHGKVFLILERNYLFIPPNRAIHRGCNYIDNFEVRLIANLKKRFIPFAEKVATNPDAYKSNKDLDIDYFIKAHNTIKTKNITV